MDGGGAEGAPEIVLVLARARNGVIGVAGDLPWRLPEDLKRFKALTLGRPVVMGRKTWDSLPRKPLPGRPNIVITRRASFSAPGATVHTNLEAGLAAAAATPDARETGEVCVIGGATLYEQTLPMARRIELTEVDLTPDGDAFCPPIEMADWTVVGTSSGVSETGLAYDYVTLRRHEAGL